MENNDWGPEGPPFEIKTWQKILKPESPLEQFKDGRSKEMNPNAELCPDSIKESLRRYVDDRVPPGSFLRGVLENNLRETFNRADFENREALGHILAFCWYEIPDACWGSKTKVNQWLDESGF